MLNTNVCFAPKQEIDEPFGKQRQLGTERPERTPNCLKGLTVALDSGKEGTLVQRPIDQFTVVHPHDFVTWFAQKGEDALERADVPDVGDLGADLFQRFAGNGLGARFTELDAPSQRAAETEVLYWIVRFVHEDSAIVAEQAYG